MPGLLEFPLRINVDINQQLILSQYKLRFAEGYSAGKSQRSNAIQGISISGVVDDIYAMLPGIYSIVIIGVEEIKTRYISYRVYIGDNQCRIQLVLIQRFCYKFTDSLIFKRAVRCFNFYLWGSGIDAIDDISQKYYNYYISE